MTDPDIILHNYPQSPVAEKARVAFGIKGLAWRSVEIPRIPPKPMLTVLTGGYRRTPVMQIGADIYCDSQCILHALERRHPSPSFYPTPESGLLRCLGRWTDGALFDLSVRIVLGSAGDALPPEFAEDRGRLYFGPDWARGLKEANSALPHLAAQMRVVLHWLDDQLADGRRFISGDAPAAIDAQFYHAVWFIRGRWDRGPAFLSEFARLERWEADIAALGHGTMTPMSAGEAIAVARAAEPTTTPGITDPLDPQGLAPGMAVTVSPDLDGGEQPVQGVIVSAAADVITLRRSDPETGTIHVHFPRAGYRVDIA